MTEKDFKSSMDAVNKKYGAGSIMLLGDAGAVHDVLAVSTGAFTLDKALGIGGLPRGRITEIYGPEQSGKTTLCLHVAKSCQANGGNVAFIDAEHRLDKAYAERIGVDINKLAFHQPNCGEEGLDVAHALISGGGCDVVIIDSVAALVPKAEIDGEFGSACVGLHARMMSQAMRKLTGAINRTNTLCIFTNQIREKVGVMYGSPETTPGGRALKFYASVRINMRKIAILEDKDKRPCGSRSKAKIVKNKVAPPYQEAEFDILFASGIDWWGSIMDAAIQSELVTRRGAWFSFQGENIGQGRDKSVEAIKESQELRDSILSALVA